MKSKSVSRLVAFLLFFGSAHLVNGRQYTFTGNGSWIDPANWRNRLAAPVYLTSQDTVWITGSAVMGSDLENCPMGDCADFGGGSKGTIIVNEGATLTIKFGTHFSNEGIMRVFGTVVNKTNFEGFESQHISIAGVFVNELMCANQGTIVIEGSGTFHNKNSFDNNMSDEAKGTLEFGKGGKIVNDATARFTPGELKGDAIFNGKPYNSDTWESTASPDKP